ncbi:MULTISPECIES: hypothetical protein [unclassified Streptomyces]|uniref:hypothetical protein n=1 Tax=unclassified Streptomyces TaxID=2593676 RepID=UPI002DD87630|nr:hypothetical protein [Streptomyces sp. NBC_01445]WSE11421.1 hypothetical protein OG574_50400 [Streptomyces sp. NBC_01445]
MLAFTTLQAVEQALPEYRGSALGQLGRTEEAEAEARRAYKTEQNRRWFKHNPYGADAVAAATKAADAARERTAQHLLAVRLEQLREQALGGTETTPTTPWMDRLPEVAARPLHSDVATVAYEPGSGQLAVCPDSAAWATKTRLERARVIEVAKTAAVQGSAAPRPTA